MNRRVKKAASRFWALRIALLFCVACPALVFAAKKKDYPIAGNVAALGTHEVIAGNQGVSGVHRTYTVKTPTKVFILECSYWINGIHFHSPSECGGDKTIAIGDVLHFRIEKNVAFIPMDNGKEQRLGILSAGTNNEGAAKPSANKASANP